jgi:hypothetical protein
MLLNPVPSSRPLAWPFPEGLPRQRLEELGSCRASDRGSKMGCRATAHFCYAAIYGRAKLIIVRNPRKATM